MVDDIQNGATAEGTPSGAEERRPVVAVGGAGRRVQLTSLCGSCLCLLASASFCHLFSRFQFTAVVVGAGVDPRELPAVCRALAWYGPALYLLPPVVLLVGATLLLRRRAESVAVEAVVQGALVLAVVGIVVCILAWQVPYAPPPGAEL